MKIRKTISTVFILRKKTRTCWRFIARTEIDSGGLNGGNSAGSSIDDFWKEPYRIALALIYTLTTSCSAKLDLTSNENALSGGGRLFVVGVVEAVWKYQSWLPRGLDYIRRAGWTIAIYLNKPCSRWGGWRRFGNTLWSYVLSIRNCTKLIPELSLDRWRHEHPVSSKLPE